MAANESSCVVSDTIYPREPGPLSRISDVSCKKPRPGGDRQDGDRRYIRAGPRKVSQGEQRTRDAPTDQQTRWCSNMVNEILT